MDGNLPGSLQHQLARTLFSPFAFLAKAFAAALASTSPVTATTVLPRLVNSGHEPRPVVPGQKETRQAAKPAGLLRHHLSLFFADDLAHSVLGFADAAANVTLSLLGFALALEMAVAEHLTGFLLYRAGTFLNAAFDPFPVHFGLLHN